MEEQDPNEESFIVVDREVYNDGNSPPRGAPTITGETIPVNIVEELAAASDSTECHISDMMVTPGGSNLSVLPSGIDLENCSVEIERLKEENILLQDEVKKQQGKMKEVMEQCRQIGADAHRLREEDNVKYEQSRVKIQNLEKENSDLNAQVLELEKQLKDLQEKLSALETTTKDEEFVAVVEDNKEEQLAASKRRLEELQELLSLEKTQTDELKNRLREIQLNSSEAGQTNEKASIVELNKKIVENDDEIQTLRAQLESSLLQLDSLKSQIETKTTEKEVLTAEKEGVVKGNLELQNRLSEVQNQLHEMTLVKKKCEDDVNAFKAEILRLQSSSNTNTCMEELQHQILEKDDQIQTLQVSFESSQIALEESKKWCDILNRENSDLKKTREGLLKEIEDLHSERVARRSSEEDSQREIDELRTEKRSLAQRLNDRDVSFQELSVQRQKIEEVCAKYRQKNQILNEELEKTRNTPSLNDEETSILRLRCTELDLENSKLKTQIAALSTENESINHWKAQCDEYAADYQRAIRERETLENQLAQMNAQLEEMHAKEANQQKELTDLHQTHLRLAQEHVNGEPADSFSSTGSTEGSEGRKNDDIIGQVLNQFKRGVSSLFWDSEVEDNPPSSSANPPSPTSQPARENVPTAPPAATSTIESQHDFTELPPCPVCGRVFYSYDNLVKHCGTCGDNGSVMSTNSYGSHMDPFVFVPQQ
ncbi:unnamed protein product [Allacma fusca]|uniref:Uncharacterized protein n=1 Tax=Allacma fusca TaxID=39272 RepID=A0A8J2NUW6_9HEXA|nr:unnamed protein product [Allacma fusca]